MTLPDERRGRSCTGGGENFSQGRANQQSSGHAAARHLDEVGAGDGAECHLKGHLKVEPQRIKFLIQGVYDVLPCPSNLCIWGKIETPACPLCSKIGTLEHILSSCSKALGEGRYQWRLDQVRKSIAEAIGKGISRHTQATAKAIHFIREGQKPEKASKNCSVGLLSTARDWAMTVDLERQLKIPTHITQSKLRPDIILVSEATKQLILLELTVPWEERMEEAQERKREKYQELVDDCQRNG